MEAVQESKVKVSRPIEVVQSLVLGETEYEAVYSAMPKTSENFASLSQYFAVAATTATGCGCFTNHASIMIAWLVMQEDWRVLRDGQ